MFSPFDRGPCAVSGASRGPTWIGRAALALSPALLAGCVSYEPAPLDPLQVLRDLEQVAWNGDRQGSSAGLTPDRLASFAVTHHPSLAQLRAEVGVTQALLIEAGLLQDPELGWDGMDALASQLVEGTTSSVDFVAGLGISIPLPRPGELEAQKGQARWRVEEARHLVVQAEWALTRAVYISFEDVLEAESLLAQNQELTQVAQTTREYFERALGAGAATAIQANLASGDLLAIRAQRIRLEARLRAARQRLNALLGLPPSADVPVAPAATDEPSGENSVDPTLLVQRSLSLRPDLAALLAAYQASEQGLRLEVARQFPQVAIGTGLWFVPGVLTRFNRPAIATATARRESLRGETEAVVHEVRQEIHDAYASFEESRRETGFLESELLPNAEESLRLAGEAVAAGEVTLLEILALQRALIDARTRTTEARAELRRRLWRLRSASGALLTAKHGTTPAQDEQESPVR